MGINQLGRIDESMGSCEDVAEVLGFYALRNLSKTLGDKSILGTTPYQFAEYSDNSFYDIIATKTNFQVDSSTLYGCLSKNCVEKNADMIFGDSLLGLVVPSKNVLSSSANTIFNYNRAFGELQLQASAIGQDVTIHPVCSRYLANLTFWDYFYANADRHCRNVIFQKVAINDRKYLIKPVNVIDNGGGLDLQFGNCKKRFEYHMKRIEQTGYVEAFRSSSDYQFCRIYELQAGKESFTDQETRDNFRSLKAHEKIVSLISNSQTLYQDFANMYKSLDFAKAISDMRTELGYKPNFLPFLSEVSMALLNYKRHEISEVMAKTMGEDFDEETFDKSPNYYIDKFQSYIKDENLNLHIATDEEIKEFDENFESDNFAQRSDISISSFLQQRTKNDSQQSDSILDDTVTLPLEQVYSQEMPAFVSQNETDPNIDFSQNDFIKQQPQILNRSLENHVSQLIPQADIPTSTDCLPTDDLSQ